METVPEKEGTKEDSRETTRRPEGKDMEDQNHGAKEHQARKTIHRKENNGRRTTKRKEMRAARGRVTRRKGNREQRPKRGRI